MNLDYQTKNLSILILTLFTLALFFLKVKLFHDFFPYFDSAFYNKWIIDLINSERFLPDGNSDFIKNLIYDYNSFLHNFFRRVYNDIGVLYNIIPVVFNVVVGKIIVFDYVVFNFNSIFINSLIPYIICLSISNKILINEKLNTIKLIVIFIFLSSFNLFFFFSPLGIHNYGLLALLISFLILEKNYKNKNFLNLKIIILTIFFPCFTHKFNIPIIFTTFFIIIFYRFYNNKSYVKEVVQLLILFLIIISPIIILSDISKNNSLLFDTFFSQFSQSYNDTLLLNIKNYLFYNLKNFISYFWGYFNIIGSILFLICFSESRFSLIKIFLISIFLIFIFLPISPWTDRLFNYFLLFSMILLSNYFLFKKYTIKYLSNIFQLIFFMFIVNNFLNIYVPVLQSDFHKKIIFKYQNSKLWNERFERVLSVVEDKKIVFYEYKVRDAFFSFFNKIDKNKKVYQTPPIAHLANKFKDQNFQYLKDIKFDKNKYKETYILYLYPEDENENFINTFCYLQKKLFFECEDLKIIENINYSNPITYQRGHDYQLILYRTF